MFKAQAQALLLAILLAMLPTLPTRAADVCFSPESQKFGAVINLTASGQVIAGAPGTRIYICSISLLGTTAGSAALVEGTGTTCATNTFGLAGGATAATGWPLPATGGIAYGNGAGTIINPSADPNSLGANVCLLLATTGQTSGHITYVRQ